MTTQEIALIDERNAVADRAIKLIDQALSGKICHYCKANRVRIWRRLVKKKEGCVACYNLNKTPAPTTAQFVERATT